MGEPNTNLQRHTILSRRQLLVNTAAAGGLSAATTALSGRNRPPSRLIYTSPTGVAFSVTADGLSSIHVRGREVATGAWRLRSAEALFKIGTEKIDAETILHKTIQVIGARAVRVRHEHPVLVAAYEYYFDGEDVTITARVQNNHPSADLTVSSFEGLVFSFGRIPQGVMPAWNTTFLSKVKLDAFHPSPLNRIGGSYAADGSFGIGLSPRHSGLERTCFLWQPEERNNKTPGTMWHAAYIVPGCIPAGGARTFEMTIRVSKNTDWRHLLEPYRDHFQRTFGPRRYVIDHRLIGMSVIDKNVASISPQNPYGFFDDFRRLDLPAGTAAFCDRYITSLQRAGGQGLIIWGQTGEDPRGAMYRPDFDVLPPEVEQNWRSLADRFQQAGLRLGVCARPGEVAYRVDWRHDQTLRLNPDDPAHLEMMWRRFESMIRRGCSLFYLDSFGDRLDDVKIMRYLRDRLGPGIQTFAEHQCDAIMALTGAYTATNFWATGTAMGVPENTFLPLIGMSNWEIYRWLLGDLSAISQLDHVHGEMPAGFEQIEHFLYRNHISPISQHHALFGEPERLRLLQTQYVDGRGQWRQ